MHGRQSGLPERVESSGASAEAFLTRAAGAHFLRYQRTGCDHGRIKPQRSSRLLRARNLYPAQPEFTAAEYLAITPEGDIFPCRQFVDRAEYLMGGVLWPQLESQSRKSSAPACFTKTPALAAGRGSTAEGDTIPNAFNHSPHQPYAPGCSLQAKHTEAAIYLQVWTKLNSAQSKGQKNV